MKNFDTRIREGKRDELNENIIWCTWLFFGTSSHIDYETHDTIIFVQKNGIIKIPNNVSKMLVI